jgi:ankyrin repeat protein
MYRTPLHLACALGHASMLSKLFEWNANPKAVDKEGCTPLIKVCAALCLCSVQMNAS